MIPESVYLHYMNALLDGDKKQCAQIVTNLLEEKISLKEIYLNLFHRSMLRIGQMWEKNKCSIAEECFATKITDSLIELTVFQSYPIEKINKSVVVTCVDKVYHELDAKMIAAFFEVNGWDSLFLSSSTPLNDFLCVIRKRRFDVVSISVSFYMNLTRLTKLISLIKYNLPEQKIIIGGQALINVNWENLIAWDNVQYIPSLNELDEFINQETNSKSRVSGL